MLEQSPVLAQHHGHTRWCRRTRVQPWSSGLFDSSVPGFGSVPRQQLGKVLNRVGRDVGQHARPQARLAGRHPLTLGIDDQAIHHRLALPRISASTKNSRCAWAARDRLERRQHRRAGADPFGQGGWAEEAVQRSGVSVQRTCCIGTLCPASKDRSASMLSSTVFAG
jgi:hypothetical protein